MLDSIGGVARVDCVLTRTLELSSLVRYELELARDCLLAVLVSNTRFVSCESDDQVMDLSGALNCTGKHDEPDKPELTGILIRFARI